MRIIDYLTDPNGNNPPDSRMFSPAPIRSTPNPRGRGNRIASMEDHDKTKEQLIAELVGLRLLASKLAADWVESQSERGSTFHFTARFERQNEDVVRAIKPNDVALINLSVLVVDDNATSRQILQEILVHWRMSPAVAGSGKEALQILQQTQADGRPFQLALIDVQMPEMDGFQLLKQIKQNPDLAETTIIILSPSAQSGDVARCRELGGAAHLTKPVRQSELYGYLSKPIKVEELYQMIETHTAARSAI
jgi:CheY-like chemotaxis protein